MKISVVIPAYNEEHYIGECLDHILKNSAGTLHEIIVVDNASTDRTHHVATSRAGVRVVTETIKGLTRARQRGLEEATGDLIAYVDADTRMPVGWLEKARQTFAERSDVVSLSGPYQYYDGTRWKNAIMTGIWYVTAPITFRIVGYMVLGGNFIAKKSALLAMGGFDKSINFYGEDTDIARRLSKHGKVLFRMDFFIYSSSRRLDSEGLIKTNIVYGLNFLWEAIFHRPFTSSYRDIRITNTATPISVLNNSHSYTTIARNKALLWSAVFGVVGLIMWLRILLPIPNADFFVALPLGIFYAILVINTFFSIRLFASITKKENTLNNILDIILGFLYVLMSFSFGNPWRFVFFDLLLFITATAKYSFLLGTTVHEKLLKKKILIDLSGVTLSALGLGGVIFGYPLESAWAMCVIFAIANILIFFVWPLYKIETK